MPGRNAALRAHAQTDGGWSGHNLSVAPGERSVAPAIADSEGTFHDDSMLELKLTRLDPKPFVFRISTIRFSRSVRALVLSLDPPIGWAVRSRVGAFGEYLES